MKFKADRMKERFKIFLKGVKDEDGLNMQSFTREVLAMAGNLEDDDSDGTESIITLSESESEPVLE